MSEKPFLIKTLHYLIYLIVVLIPIFVSKQFIFSFTQGKTFLLYFLVEIALAIWIYAALVQKEYRPKKHPILIAGGLFLTFYTVSSIIGINTELSFSSTIHSMTGLILLYHIAAFIVLVSSVVRDKQAWNKVFVSFISGGLVVLSVSYLTQFFPEVLPSYLSAGSTIGNSSYAGVYLMFVFFLSLLLLNNSQGWQKKLATFTLGATLLSPILFNLRGVSKIFEDPLEVLGIARASTGALWVGIAIYLLFKHSFSAKKVTKTVSRIILITISVALLISSVSVLSPTSLTRTLLEKEDLGSRGVFWEIAMENIAARPILGWGAESYFYTFYKSFDPILLTPEYDHGTEAFTSKPHNVYLEVLLGGGGLGLVSYLSIFALIVYLPLRQLLQSRLSEKNAGVIIALTTSYLIQNILVFDTVTSYLSLSILLSYTIYSTQEQKDYTSISRYIKWSKLTTSLTAFVLVFVYLFYLPYYQQRLLTNMATKMNPSERALLYEDLFKATPQSRTSTMTYVMQNIQESIYSTAFKEGDGGNSDLLKEVKSLRMEVEKHTSPSTNHYRMLLALVRLLHTEYILETSIDERLSILSKIKSYEKTLISLSPKNTINQWAISQRQIFEGDIESAVSTLETSLRLSPGISITKDILEEVKSHQTNPNGILILSY